MAIRNSIAKGNGGDGFRFEGVEPDMDGCIAEDNGEHGFNVISESASQAMRSLSLPMQLDPKEIAELLQALVSTPVDERSVAVKSSKPFRKLAKLGLDVSSFAANILTLVKEPHIQQWIAQLMS